MNYVKINVVSNYVKLKLYISEKQCYEALCLIRLIHENTPVGQINYSPCLGNFKHPENNLCVTIKKVAFYNKLTKKTRLILKEIEYNSLEKLKNQLAQYKAAA